MRHDVIIVGGGFAGLSAAMQLGRARRRVLVIDAGLPRNRFADASHGFFGQDGKAPAEIFCEAARQVAAYPTVAFIQGEATAAAPDGEGFVVTLADGRTERGRKLVLAGGIVDHLPQIPGLKERWGATVLHCPYCHGYEVRDRALGVLANHPMAPHQAEMLPDWGPTTYYTQGRFEPDADTLAVLARRGVMIERQPIVEVVGAAPAMAAVRLADGRIVTAEALFVAPRTTLASPLAEQLGCAIDAGMLGPVIRVDEMKATTVGGVYAAGDATRSMHNATFASADGVMAGVAAHRALIQEDGAIRAAA
jgi:thioredoxin reductase